MALELNKLTGQVAAMGQAMAARADKLAGRADQARELLASQPEVSDELKRKIEAARRIDEWRRGCIPLGDRLDERCRPVVQPKLSRSLRLMAARSIPTGTASLRTICSTPAPLCCARGRGKRPQ